MKSTMKTFLIIILAGATAALTYVVRIPIPGTGGYLNFGDIAVVFCGLFLGKKYGAVAGGVGSALADVIGGFFVFAPITLVAKGLEGFLAGTIGGMGKSTGDFKSSILKMVIIFLTAGIAMVAVYFISELFLPGVGFGAALNEIPFNLTQAFVGAFGGYFVYYMVTKAIPSKAS